MRKIALTVAAAAALYASQALAQTTNLAPFQTTVTAGTTAIMAAVPANPTRRGLMLCNVGAMGVTIYVTFGPGTVTMPNTPSATNGIPIPGGALPNSCLDLLPWSSANIGMGAQINVVASMAGTPVTVLEF